MIAYLLVTLSLILSNARDTIEVNQDGYNAKLNSLVDEVVANIGLSGREIGLEPLKIPDIHQEKEKNGDVQVFNLTQGELSNLISIQRFGDAEASYKSGVLNMKVGFQFSDLEGNFNFIVKSWGLNPIGHLNAKIPNLIVTLETSVDAVNLNATLDKILIPSVGDLQISIKTSKPIYGMIMDALIDTFTIFFQDELIYILGKVIRIKGNEMLAAVGV